MLGPGLTLDASGCNALGAHDTHDPVADAIVRRIEARIAGDLDKYTTIADPQAGGGAWVRALIALQERQREAVELAGARLEALKRKRDARDVKLTDEDRAERKRLVRVRDRGVVKGLAMDLDPMAPALELAGAAKRWKVIAPARSWDVVWAGFLVSPLPRVQIVVGNPPYSVPELLYTADGHPLLYPPSHKRAGQQQVRKHVVAELHVRRALACATMHAFQVLPLSFLGGLERNRDADRPQIPDAAVLDGLIEHADRAFWRAHGQELRGIWPLVPRPPFGDAKGTAAAEYAVFWWDKRVPNPYTSFQREYEPLDWEAVE